MHWDRYSAPCFFFNHRTYLKEVFVLPQTSVRMRLLQMIWCCSSLDATQLSGMMFYLHDHSAKYEQQHALWEACFHTHTANVSLSIPLARTVAQYCSISLLGTVPQINRYTLQAVGGEGSNVNGPVGSPVCISAAATLPSLVYSLHSFVKVKAWMWYRRWFQPVFSVACPMCRKAVWRCGEAALHRAPCAPTRTNSTACCT